MGLFGLLFGKKNQPQPKPVPQESEPLSELEARLEKILAEQKEGLDYMEVRKIEDPAKRVPLMMQYAEKGDELAMYEVGELYVFGRDGVKQDVEKGKKYLYEAGQKGAFNATARLAQVCFKYAFEEITKDNIQKFGEDACFERFWPRYDEGVGHLAWAVAKGNVLAMDTLTGTLSLGWNQGELGEKLVKETAKALEPHLAELKNADTAESSYTLGVLSMRGIAMPQDFAAARAYLERAARKGHYEAARELKNPLLAMDDDEDEED